MDFATFITDREALLKAMVERHSVRQYTDAPLPDGLVGQLRDALDIINDEHWTDMQLVTEEPHAFGGIKAKYGKFSDVRNYIVLVGPECKELSEILGYAGEKLVLYAQSLGLNTCWVGASYRETARAYRVEIGNSLKGVISIGFGQTQGSPSKSVSPEVISKQYAEAPQWFKDGIDAALLAPTAINQQKFRFDLKSLGEQGEKPLVRAHSKRGPYSKMDLGIAKLHFEVGAGPDSFDWS